MIATLVRRDAANRGIRSIAASIYRGLSAQSRIDGDRRLRHRLDDLLDRTNTENDASADMVL